MVHCISAVIPFWSLITSGCCRRVGVAWRPAGTLEHYKDLGARNRIPDPSRSSPFNMIKAHLPQASISPFCQFPIVLNLPISQKCACILFANTPLQQLDTFMDRIGLERYGPFPCILQGGSSCLYWFRVTFNKVLHGRLVQKVKVQRI